MQTDALDLLHELKNHPEYNLTKLKQYLNRGVMEFVRRTECIEGTIDVTTVAEEFEYTESETGLLAYLKRPYQFRYVDSSSEVGEPLSPFQGGYTNLPKTKSYGKPHYYWIRHIAGKLRTAPSAFTGIRLGTWPIAGTSGKTIRIDCYQWPRILSDDTDFPEFNDAWHDAIVYYAVYRFYLNFSHLRKGWHTKALEMKALFKININCYK